jgi:hypothetical protein
MDTLHKGDDDDDDDDIISSIIMCKLPTDSSVTSESTELIKNIYEQSMQFKN